MNNEALKDSQCALEAAAIVAKINQLKRKAPINTAFEDSNDKVNSELESE